jgi:biopolymer transport protein ExbD
MSATSGMGGGKSVNVELNLVPFIDLLSTLICFLLITAAWQEMDVMSSSAPPKATAEIPETPQPPPPPDEKKKVALVVSLGLDKIDISEDDATTPIPHVGGEPDISKLTEILQGWKTRFPERKDLVLATDNKAKYKYLVLLMDVLIKNDFPDVGINLN